MRQLGGTGKGAGGQGAFFLDPDGVYTSGPLVIYQCLHYVPIKKIEKILSPSQSTDRSV